MPEIEMKPKKTISRRAFLRAAVGLSGGLALSGPLGWLYAKQVEPRWLQVERARLVLPRWPVELSGYTVCLLSDLHLGPYADAEYARAVVNLVLAQKPQLIVGVGDFVSTLQGGEAETLTQELARLSAPEGVYATLGNHDWWTNAARVAAALEKAGIKLVRNAHTLIQPGGKPAFYLAGVDDVWEEKHDLARALADIPAEAPVILLAHEPDYADTAAAQAPPVLLQLSGHTHGGQVRAPGLAPFAAPYLGRKYPNGLFRIGDLQLYVTRGLGVVTPPVRFNCRPEVTLLTLTSA